MDHWDTVTLSANYQPAFIQRSASLEGSKVAPSPSTLGEVSKSSRSHACVLCQQRKVKCDRQSPCLGCRKANAQCIYGVSVLPRRRRKVFKERDLQERGPQEKGQQVAELLTRLRRYEELLKIHGVKPEEYGSPIIDGSSPSYDNATLDSLSDSMSRSVGISEGMSPEPESGRLIRKQGMSRYLDNNLWKGLSKELQDPSEVLQESSEDDESELSVETGSNGVNAGGSLIFGTRSKNSSLYYLHPQPVQIFQLWQKFLDNVNPLVKVTHAPTIQQRILEAVGNLENLPKNMEALLFSIYSCSVGSMTNDECLTMFGEPKSAMLAQYHNGARQALINAGFLKSSDLIVLQAYLLYLLSARQSLDASTIWMYSGIAVRAGRRIGLQRDGALLGLSPFESEFRRRLWWTICILDGRSAELCGCGSLIAGYMGNIRMPLNVNDSDLYPDMREPPVEHTGATEMFFCLIRFEVGIFIKKWSSERTFDGSWAKLNSAGVSMADKDKAIDELERILERKYVRHCDPRIPLHLITKSVAQVAICRMRLLAHHPRQYSDQGAHLPQSEKDALTSYGLTMLEVGNVGQATPSLQKWHWHAKTHFQFDGFIYLLSDLRQRTSGELADRAWPQITKAYRYHPELLADTKNPLYSAVRNLTLAAWEKREADPANRLEAPAFIQTIRSMTRRPSKKASASASASQHIGSATVEQPQSSKEEQLPSLDPSLPSQLDMIDISPMDWDYWDDLLRGAEIAETADLEIDGTVGA